MIEKILVMENNINISIRDRLYIAALIEWHMRPYVEMGEKKRQKEREMLGEDFCRDLDLLHEADEASK